jgi:RNA polymerase sigma-70 factor (ECF subfamily)
MGVLQMAMPAAGLMPERPRDRRAKTGGFLSGLKWKAAAQLGTAARAEAGAGAGAGVAARDTLLPPATVRRQVPAKVSAGTPARTLAQAGHEATLQRTAEQQATEEILGRLVRRCMAGDQQAWQQLVTAQHRRIYAICYRFTGSAMDAEDLTQEVFLKLYRNLASFDTHKGSFQTWITTLARNLLVDHFRRTRLERATDSLDASYGNGDGDSGGMTMGDRLADTRPTQEAHASGLELRAKIQQALSQLSPELREAVVFRDLEDMDYKEIAQVLRIPEGTVKSRISRGRGELARILQRIEGQVV